MYIVVCMNGINVEHIDTLGTFFLLLFFKIQSFPSTEKKQKKIMSDNECRLFLSLAAAANGHYFYWLDIDNWNMKRERDGRISKLLLTKSVFHFCFGRKSEREKRHFSE